MTDKSLAGLYAITPDGLDEPEFFSRVSAALRGGVRILQYRDKTGGADRRLRVARRLRTLCDDSGALLIVNDDVSLAIAIGAAGVHLGGDDGDLSAARSALGAHRILGASCYNDFDRAVVAKKAGADYVAFGAVFPSPTKPRAVRADLSLLTRSRDELAIPVCAIGGITTGNVSHVIAAGADMVAVITDLFDAPDVENRAHIFQSFFEEHPREHP